MHRRNFVRLAGLSVPAGALLESHITARLRAEPARATPAPKANLKVGHQHLSTNEALRLFAALGVNHICSDLPSAKFSLMSSSTISLASSQRAQASAQVAPTLPAPTTVIFISGG